ncbi:MAG TPA: endonuclease VII domain-containing protein [Mycobacteriales bacterium]|nr:endonuclease VII domain-containing protein [Mycobacteriales bacterium]
MGTEKFCPDCKRLLPLDEFPRNKNSRDGRHTYCKPCHNARCQETRQRLYGGSRHYHLMRRYGISEAEVQELIREQRGVCAICGVRPAEHVDHDHETGRVRGILCFTCNVGIANFGEDRERMRFAMIYLEIHDYIKRRESA